MSLKVTGNSAIRQITYEFLFKFHGKHVTILHRLYPRGASDARLLAVVVSVRLLEVGIVSKRLNVGSRKRHMIAQGL